MKRSWKGKVVVNHRDVSATTSAGYRTPVRQWLKRLLFAGGLVAAAASL